MWFRSPISCWIVVILANTVVDVRSKRVTLLDTKRSTTELRWPTYSLSNDKDSGWIEETFNNVVEGSSSRAYVVCEVDQSAVDNWVRTPFIASGRAERLHVQMTFTMRDCREFPGTTRSCKETFTLYALAADADLAAAEQPPWTDAAWTLVDRIAPDQGRFDTKDDVHKNVETRSVAVDGGVYFAFRDQGACISLLAVRVYYELCEQTVAEFAVFRETPAGREVHALVEQRGSCVPNAAPVAVAAPKYLCKADGSWDLLNGGCRCNPGFTPTSTQQCLACESDTYKDLAGEGDCLPCPDHSSAPTDSSAQCNCDAGYYRADADPKSTACTRPPDRPRSVRVESVDQDGAVIVWAPPDGRGGRAELWYRVECKNCPQSTTYTPAPTRLNVTRVALAGLQPSTLYSLFIYAENDVSAQVAGMPMYTVVELETNKLAPLHVTRLHVVDVSATTVNLEWQAPEVPLDYYESEAAGGQAETDGRRIGVEPAARPDQVQYYQVRHYAKRRHYNTSTEIVQSTAALFKGLQPDTEYGFQVRAYTPKGWGAWSELVWTRTAEGGAETPRSPRADNVVLVVLAIVLVIALCLVCFICYLRRFAPVAKKQPSDLDVLDYKHDRFTPDYQFACTANGTLGRGKPGAPLMSPFSRVDGFKPYVDPLAYEDPNDALREFANEIASESVYIDQVIGGGEFGEVCLGKLRGGAGRRADDVEAAAIKTLKPGSTTKAKADFLAEASIMGQFVHPNVIRLLGVVTKSEPVMIITEYMANRSLDSFLRANDGRIVVEQLIAMLRGIAAGMKYLSDKGYVHRDLAARNVLVDDLLTCKIADFGLSRGLEGSVEQVYTTKGGKIPVRWTAPEAIAFRKFTSASDVWSFGILCWETISFGERPYFDWSNQDVIQKIDEGYRLPPPMDCPPALHHLMLDCWRTDRHARPTFAALVQTLDSFLHCPELLHCSSRTTSMSSISRVTNAYQPDGAPPPLPANPCPPAAPSAGGSVDELLRALGLSHCATRLRAAGVVSPDSLLRLNMVDYLNYGLEQAEAQQLRDALRRLQCGSLARRPSPPVKTATLTRGNGYQPVATQLQPPSSRSSQQHGDGFFV